MLPDAISVIVEGNHDRQRREKKEYSKLFSSMGVTSGWGSKASVIPR